ncbi:MAG: hypothetical protein ABSD08_08135 [Xanthobacteraceae bacterium]
MPSIRMVAPGAFFLAFLVMTVGGAMAQTATNTAPGKPIQLLQVLTQPDKTKTKPHAKLLAKTAKKTTKTHSILTAGKRSRHPQRIASAAAPADVWPVLTPATAPANIAAAEPAPQPASASTKPTPSELVVGGRTVQVVSPDDVNAIDLAANEADAATSTPMASAAAATTSAPTADAEPKSDSLKTAPPQRAGSAVGSASWIAQVLAALGGAVAAGSVAWILIGSAPQRMYG